MHGGRPQPYVGVAGKGPYAGHDPRRRPLGAGRSSRIRFCDDEGVARYPEREGLDGIQAKFKGHEVPLER